jgi:hypothetical protein
MLVSLLQWIYDLSISQTIREGTWQFPALEVIHIYSMIFLITAAMLFDLSFVGLPLGRQTISQLSRTSLRWTWICFAVNAASGTLIFASLSTEYYVNPAFQVKILLIVLAMAVHTVVFRMATRWETVPPMAFGAKLLLGGSSLLLWIGVIFASRWIAYVKAV